MHSEQSQSQRQTSQQRGHDRPQEQGQLHQELPKHNIGSDGNDAHCQNAVDCLVGNDSPPSSSSFCCGESTNYMKHVAQSSSSLDTNSSTGAPKGANNNNGLGWRVKLYKLNADGSWDDCGTGRISCHYSSNNCSNSGIDEEGRKEISATNAGGIENYQDNALNKQCAVESSGSRETSLVIGGNSFTPSPNVLDRGASEDLLYRKLSNPVLCMLAERSQVPRNTKDVGTGRGEGGKGATSDDERRAGEASSSSNDLKHFAGRNLRDDSFRPNLLLHTRILLRDTYQRQGENIITWCEPTFVANGGIQRSNDDNDNNNNDGVGTTTTSATHGGSGSSNSDKTFNHASRRNDPLQHQHPHQNQHHQQHHHHHAPLDGSGRTTVFRNGCSSDEHQQSNTLPQQEHHQNEHSTSTQRHGSSSSNQITGQTIGVDLALSFQDNAGCLDIWSQITAVQQKALEWIQSHHADTATTQPHHHHHHNTNMFKQQQLQQPTTRKRRVGLSTSSSAGQLSPFLRNTAPMDRRGRDELTTGATSVREKTDQGNEGVTHDLSNPNYNHNTSNVAGGGGGANILQHHSATNNGPGFRRRPSSPQQHLLQHQQTRKDIVGSRNSDCSGGRSDNAAPALTTTGAAKHLYRPESPDLSSQDDLDKVNNNNDDQASCHAVIPECSRVARNLGINADADQQASMVVDASSRQQQKQQGLPVCQFPVSPTKENLEDIADIIHATVTCQSFVPLQQQQDQAPTIDAEKEPMDGEDEYQNQEEDMTKEAFLMRDHEQEQEQQQQQESRLVKQQESKANTDKESDDSLLATNSSTPGKGETAQSKVNSSERSKEVKIANTVVQRQQQQQFPPLKHQQMQPLSREALGLAITGNRNEYFMKLLELFSQLESENDLASLCTLASITKSILFLNEPSLLEAVVDNPLLFEKVCGVMEFDPELRAKAAHRYFLHHILKFRTVVFIRDASLIEGIQKCWRVQYLKDTLLRPTMEEGSLATLASLLHFAQNDVVRGVTSCTATSSSTSRAASPVMDMTEDDKPSCSVQQQQQQQQRQQGNVAESKFEDCYLARILRILGTELYCIRAMEQLSSNTGSTKKDDSSSRRHPLDHGSGFSSSNRNPSPPLSSQKKAQYEFSEESARDNVLQDSRTSETSVDGSSGTRLSPKGHSRSASLPHQHANTQEGGSGSPNASAGGPYRNRTKTPMMGSTTASEVPSPERTASSSGSTIGSTFLQTTPVHSTTPSFDSTSFYPASTTDSSGGHNLLSSTVQQSPSPWKQHLLPQDSSLASRRLRRRGSLEFLRELFNMVRTSLQQSAKDDFYAMICLMDVTVHINVTGVDGGQKGPPPGSSRVVNLLQLLGSIISDCRGTSNEEKCCALEIISGVTCHDPSLIRRHILDEPCKRPRRPEPVVLPSIGKCVIFPTSEDDLLLALCSVMAIEKDAGLLLQALEILRIVLDTDLHVMEHDEEDGGSEFEQHFDSMLYEEVHDDVDDAVVAGATVAGCLGGGPGVSGSAASQVAGHKGSSQSVLAHSPATGASSIVNATNSNDHDEAVKSCNKNKSRSPSGKPSSKSGHGKTKEQQQKKNNSPGAKSSPSLSNNDASSPGGPGTPIVTANNPFLSIFYEHYIYWLLAPFQYTVSIADYHIASASDPQRNPNTTTKHFTKHPPAVVVPIPKCAARAGFALELLCFCVRAHCYRMKSYVLRSRVISCIAKLLQHGYNSSGDTCLRLAALRFLRSVIAVKDEFYHRYIVQHDLFSYVFEAFRRYPVGDNLVSSSIIEMCDFIRTENIRTLLEYIVTKYILNRGVAGGIKNSSSSSPPDANSNAVSRAGYSAMNYSRHNNLPRSGDGSTTTNPLIMHVGSGTSGGGHHHHLRHGSKRMRISLEDLARPHVDTFTLMRQKYEENLHKNAIAISSASGQILRLSDRDSQSSCSDDNDEIGGGGERGGGGSVCNSSGSIRRRTTFSNGTAGGGLSATPVGGGGQGSTSNPAVMSNASSAAGQSAAADHFLHGAGHNVMNGAPGLRSKGTTATTGDLHKSMKGNEDQQRGKFPDLSNYEDSYFNEDEGDEMATTAADTGSNASVRETLEDKVPVESARSANQFLPNDHDSLGNSQVLDDKNGRGGRLGINAQHGSNVDSAVSPHGGSIGGLQSVGFGSGSHYASSSDDEDVESNSSADDTDSSTSSIITNASSTSDVAKEEIDEPPRSTKRARVMYGFGEDDADYSLNNSNAPPSSSAGTSNSRATDAATTSSTHGRNFSDTGNTGLPLTSEQLRLAQAQNGRG